MVTFVAKWSSSLDPTYMYMTFGVVRARQTVGLISGLDRFALEQGTYVHVAIIAS